MRCNAFIEHKNFFNRKLSAKNIFFPPQYPETKGFFNGSAYFSAASGVAPSGSGRRSTLRIIETIV